MDISNRYNLKCGDIIGDFTILDMYRSDRGQLRLKCVCNICGAQKEIQCGNMKDKPGVMSHAYCSRTNLNGLTSQHHNLYVKWVGMRNRCYDPRHAKYKSYGAKGINCDDYKENGIGFQRFLEDVGESYYAHIDMLMKKGYTREEAEKDTTLDRINPSKNYTKDNLRWLTNEEQQYNKNSVKDFIAISPEGVLYVCDIVSKFAENHDLESSCVHNCLSGQYKQHKGWRFFWRHPRPGMDGFFLFNEYSVFFPMYAIDERYRYKLNEEYIKQNNCGNYIL